MTYSSSPSGSSYTEYPSLDSPTKGAFRFNTDSSQMEIYDGNQWTGVLATSPEQQTGGTRGIWSGGRGNSPSSNTKSDVLDYVNIATTGNAVDFGNLTSARSHCGGAASRTRGLTASGDTPSVSDIIDYVTISSTGNAIDFGNLITACSNRRGVSNGTRAVFACGSTPSPFTTLITIDYVTIASTGNANDFGDMTNLGRTNAFAFQSPVRGVWGGGYDSNSSGTNTKNWEYVNIASTGNGSIGGDITYTGNYRYRVCGASNAIRGIYFGGNQNENDIGMLNLVTWGRAVFFGDLINASPYSHYTAMNAAASPTRAVTGGGGQSPYAGTDFMEYVQIMTTGNSVDFGDLSFIRQNGTAFSNGHGGL